jgi:hypothetical protein
VRIAPKIIGLFLALQLVPYPLFAATIRVPADQATIQAAVNIMNPDDVIRITAGPYNERISVTRDGTAGHPINIVAEGQVICRGFDMNGVNYVNLIGIEITHNNTTYNNGIMFSGSNSHIGLIDLYIHNIKASGGAITCAGGTTLSYITYRGNRIEDLNIVNGSVIDNPTAGISTMPNATDHALIEYNTIKRVGDFIYMHGQFGIARNNSMTQFTNAYWNFTPGVDFHIDGFQGGSDGIATGSKDQVFEANWHGENRGTENHAGIWQNTIVADDARIIIRGHVFYLVGAGGIADISTDDYFTYNNTFSDIAPDLAGAGNGVAINVRATGGDVPTGGMIRNTIVADNGNRNAIDVTDWVSYTADHNLRYNVGTHAIFSVNGDPLFVDKANKNFALQSGSPARAAGVAITTVASSTGSGTSFNVGNGKLFCEGYGIVDGDLIRVGSTNATMVRVTGISANTLTVSSSISWVNGDAVYFGNHGLDIGARPFYSAELTAATISSVGTTYTVTPTGDARGVWFYVDGIPTTWDADAPYSASIASGTVTAKAYALYAQETPVITATADAGGGLPEVAGPRFSGGYSDRGGVKHY